MLAQVPMSKADAESEVLARLAAPAQGLSYVIGKIQLFAYQHAARLAAVKYSKGKSTAFDLAAFHSTIETNGNLPFVLQMHSAGLATTLDVSFVNLHTAYAGVKPADVRARAEDPTLVRRLPGG